ncbi:glycosyltransferase family 4 protein [Luteimonas sp. MJ246]|uniref:glycosyltransferase family 4 protein n=1 Tax=Luteimonas sp. MJ174 TaxID=3129237 RepID=UPI0031BB3C38
MKAVPAGAAIGALVARTEIEKPRLLILTSTYPRWGGDPEPGFVHELAKRLTGRFQITVLCPHAPGANPAEVLEGVEVIRYSYASECLETLVNDGGIVTNLRRSKWKLLLIPGFVIVQAWRAWRLLRTRQIDIVHAHWLIPQGLIAAMLRYLPGRQVPFVVTSHGADLFALTGALLQRMKLLVIRNACAITVVSEVMRERVSKIDGGVNAVRVLPMGVDLRSRFVPAPQVQRSDNELLFVGRLVEKKGLRHLLDAMPKVLRERPDARLVIVGFGPEEAALKQQARMLGVARHVEFLGAVPQANLPDLYRRAAVFVAPFVEAASGDQEGLGLVLVEAMGCGCPVIAGDVPAVRDILGGALHRIVKARDANALATVILDTLAHQRRDLDEAQVLRKFLLEKFDWQSVSDRYAALLESCMGARP